jgi:phosphatidylethanolamine/phosphatidyl-N-methylethanolamine N-methyltransferase
MLEDLDLRSATSVLEYGPGTGVFTGSILEQIGPQTNFAAIELNSRLASLLRARHPQVSVFEDSVANVRSICDHAGMGQVDCIVSGLPWAAFPESTQIKFLDEMMRVLRPGGHFVTFAYVHGVWLPQGKRFADLLPAYFGSVSKSPVVWLNVPPAFVYRCRR